MKKQLLLLLFTAFQGQLIFAQTEVDTIRPTADKTQEDYTLAAFEIAAPDSTFIPMQNAYGWEEPATKSMVVCIPTPGSFKEMAEAEIDNEYAGDGVVKIISKENKELNGKPGVVVYGEITEDPENPFCSVMYFSPLGDNMVLMVNALYPKSQHERLYPKMLASFASARVKN